MGLSLGGIGGIAGIAQLAMGPAGWASLAMQAIVSAVAQQAIQMAGQQLGLPQQAIDVAQNAFSAASGQSPMGRNPIQQAVSKFADHMSPSQQGQLTRDAEDVARKLSRSLVESEEFKSAKSGGEKGSIFMQIAVALGKLADKKMKEMASLSKEIGAIDEGDKNKANETTQKTGEMQAKGQEFGLLSNAMSNSIKTLGESLTQLARKG